MTNHTRVQALLDEFEKSTIRDRKTGIDVRVCQCLRVIGYGQRRKARSVLKVRTVLISHFKQGIVVFMNTVSITDLKSNLSRYLREVRRGGEIQVLDRGTPVACITPPLPSGDELRNALIKAGLVRPGKGRASAILNEPPLVLSVDLSTALSEERDDRL